MTDRLTLLCERHGLQDPSQEGFRRLRTVHSTQRQVQSLHRAIEDVAQEKGQLYLSYMDFDTAFNSLDHAGQWRWLRELNVPDVDLLQSLYEAHYMADLPYGRSVPVFLTRRGKQGDKLSPQLFIRLFFALLLALRATGVGFQLVTGLRTPAWGFADDLTLVCQTRRTGACDTARASAPERSPAAALPPPPSTVLRPALPARAGAGRPVVGRPNAREQSLD